MGVNLQVVGSSTITVLLLLWVRSMTLNAFIIMCIMPAVLYALMAERTKPFGSLKGKTVLVTGASSGLGKAIALEAGRRDAKVILAARSVERLRAVAEIIGTQQAEVLPVDVTDEGALRKAIDSLSGRVDLLVNNAGAGEWKHAEETTPGEAVKMMALPYQAAFAATSLLLPSLAANKGHVLNVTSAASMTGFRGAVGYATARWAMRGFSTLLNRDVRELGVGVTLLNAAEITGTEYFADAPGKAGSASKARIPDLFQLVDALGLNYNTEQVACCGLDAVEAGWSTVLVPGWLLVPVKMIVDIMPSFIEALVALGPSGRRSAAKRQKAE